MTHLHFLPIALCGILILVASQFATVPTTPQWLFPFVQLDTLAHLGMYFCLGISTALFFSKNYGMQTVRLLGLTGLLCLTFGIADELHQMFVPGRNGEFRDLLADVSGGIAGGFTYVFVAWCAPGLRELGLASGGGAWTAVGRWCAAIALGAVIILPAAAYSSALEPFLRSLADESRALASAALSETLGELPGGAAHLASRSQQGVVQQEGEIRGPLKVVSQPAACLNTLTPRYGKEAVEIATREVARELANRIAGELRREMQAEVK